MQQVEDIAVRIGEKGQRVPVGGLRIGKKAHALIYQAGVDAGKIRNREGEVAQTGGIEAGGGHSSRRGLDDFDHGAVGSFDENGFAVGGPIVDDEIQMLDIPEGEAVWIGRCDRDVFDSGDHMRGL